MTRWSSLLTGQSIGQPTAAVVDSFQPKQEAQREQPVAVVAVGLEAEKRRLVRSLGGLELVMMEVAPVVVGCGRLYWHQLDNGPKWTDLGPSHRTSRSSTGHSSRLASVVGWDTFCWHLIWISSSYHRKH